MPSDDRVTLALEALARPIADFRSALAGALEHATAWMESQRLAPADRVALARRELGAFAAGRVDATGFAALFGGAGPSAATHLEPLERAIAVLHDVLAAGESLFVVDVADGASLARSVEDALARIGRAFGALLTVELVRGHTWVAEEHTGLLEHLDFRSWTRDERRFAPPLVVTVQGSDLHVGGLADFTDGRVKIVLVVRGPCAPAALVRLVTPGTLVLQTADATGLDRVAAFDGPAIAAIVPESAALFLHDPVGGTESWKRLSVWHTPPVPTRALGGISAWQMAEDLRQLGTLAAAPMGAPTAAAAGGADTVDRLAQWLLGQSGMTPPAA